MNHQYVWFLWASAFLLPWVFLYWRFSAYRRVMLLASFATMPFGLTEPLFVPEYWSPPSLFNLASRTGFDIESLIFCFAIGGIGVVLYSALTGKGFSRVSIEYRRLPLHRYHGLASATPFIVFPLLWLLPWNPIYPAITAMAAGAIANIFCRPELKQKTWVGGLLFLALYAVFIGGLELFMPSYIDEVWNIEGLSGIMFLRVPIEEYLFAFGFGIYWAGVYEHFTWRRPAAEERRAPVLESHSRHDRGYLRTVRPHNHRRQCHEEDLFVGDIGIVHEGMTMMGEMMRDPMAQGQAGQCQQSDSECRMGQMQMQQQMRLIAMLLRHAACKPYGSCSAE